MTKVVFSHFKAHFLLIVKISVVIVKCHVLELKHKSLSWLYPWVVWHYCRGGYSGKSCCLVLPKNWTLCWKPAETEKCHAITILFDHNDQLWIDYIFLPFELSAFFKKGLFLDVMGPRHELNLLSIGDNCPRHLTTPWFSLVKQSCVMCARMSAYL